MASIPPWERRTGEPLPAFHAFCHYRDLGTERSLTKAWAAHQGICRKAMVGGKSATLPPVPGSWTRWSSYWDWVARCEAYDADVDKQIREQLQAKILQRRGEHLEQLAMLRTALMLPGGMVLTRLKDDPVFRDSLRSMSAEDLLTLMARAAAVLPTIVTAERLVMGEATERAATADADMEGIAQKAIEDPETAKLVNQLAARLANDS